jgi:Right handed beta helix region
VLASSDEGQAWFEFLAPGADPVALAAAAGLPLRATSDGSLVVPAGRHEVADLVFVPRAPGRRLILAPGAQLRFAPGAGLISYAPLTAEGTPDLPISLDALDPQRGWLGLVVLSTNLDPARDPDLPAAGSSRLRYVTCARARGGLLNGITYTGGVSFLASDVELERCRITDCGGDDGLNVKAARVVLRDTVFVRCPSDAVDLDWCEGEVSGCLFLGSGGDGVDLSGARDLEISDCAVLVAGDKALSVGEASRATIRGCLLGPALIGVASKDLSRVTVTRTTLLRADQALSAYRKKPVFGPGQLTASSLVLVDCGAEVAADEGSEVELGAHRQPDLPPDLEAALDELADALDASAPAPRLRTLAARVLARAATLAPGAVPDPGTGPQAVLGGDAWWARAPEGP